MACRSRCSFQTIWKEVCSNGGGVEGTAEFQQNARTAPCQIKDVGPWSSLSIDCEMSFARNLECPAASLLGMPPHLFSPFCSSSRIGGECFRSCLKRSSNDTIFYQHTCYIITLSYIVLHYQHYLVPVQKPRESKIVTAGVPHRYIQTRQGNFERESFQTNLKKTDSKYSQSPHPNIHWHHILLQSFSEQKSGDQCILKWWEYRESIQQQILK